MFIMALLGIGVILFAALAVAISALVITIGTVAQLDHQYDLGNYDGKH